MIIPKWKPKGHIQYQIGKEETVLTLIHELSSLPGKPKFSSRQMTRVLLDI